MSTIEEEIAAVKVSAQKKLRRLRERERKEQLALDLRVVELLRKRDPGAYEELRVQARAQIGAQAAVRAERARRAPRSPVVGEPGDSTVYVESFATHSEQGAAGALR